MRILVTLTFILATLMSYVFLFNKADQPGDHVIDSAITLELKSEKAQVDEWGLRPGEPRRCYVFGPVARTELVGMFRRMKHEKLSSKVVLKDRFKPDRYIVYLGPLPNKTAQRAFVKQFRQQGYKHIEYLNDGVMSPGVEIESFRTRDEARAYMETQAPKVGGLKVTNVLGEPMDYSDLCLDKLTQAEESRLLRMAKRMPTKKLVRCPD